MNAATRLLRDLVAIPSINPSFAPGDKARTGEESVARHLIDIARRHGLDIARQPVLPGRRNTLITLRPTGKVQRRILLAPHLDVVPAADRQFQPVIKNDHLHGRGACDTKGSVAAYFHTLCQLAKSKQRPRHTEIIFVGLVDEECNQAGSRAFGQSKLKADLAIVGEPTMLKVVTAHKGDLWWRLETKGRAAHGARPELGRNAVHAMARIVDLLETKYAAQLKKRRHPLLGSPTINVGVMRGGHQPNVVPDHCTIDIDRRTLPGETAATVRHEITALLKPAKLKATIADLKGVDSLPLETDPALPLVRNFMRVARCAKPRGVDFFTDASPIAAGGTPALVFGPGNIAQAHTDDEWLDLNQLDTAIAILIRFLQTQP
ncbi:MAG: M20 family metallopeptidase [Verrucomicrobiota bacterium]|nr:M20 family metallopeptidase [Verrucomicrobiota bacterium]